MSCVASSLAVAQHVIGMALIMPSVSCTWPVRRHCGIQCAIGAGDVPTSISDLPNIAVAAQGCAGRCPASTAAHAYKRLDCHVLLVQGFVVLRAPTTHLPPVLSRFDQLQGCDVTRLQQLDSIHS